MRDKSSVVPDHDSNRNGSRALLHDVERMIPDARWLERLYNRTRPVDDAGRWCSSLNNDGAPFQVAVSTTQNGNLNVRLIVDPFMYGRDDNNRADATLRAIRAVVGDGRNDTGAQFEQFVAGLAPSFAGRWERPCGDVWITAGRDATSAGVYVTAKWESAASLCRRLFALVDLDLHAATILWLHQHALICAYSLQGGTTTGWTISIYWKPDQASMRSMGNSGFTVPRSDSPMPPILANAPLRALTMCSSFVVGVPQQGSKLDMCNHCIKADSRASLALLASYAPVPVRLERLITTLADRETAEVAFLGVRTRPDENVPYVYLKPASRLRPRRERS